MKTGKEVFETYLKLNQTEKVKFSRMIKRHKSEHESEQQAFAENKRLEIANDLESAGINAEWVKKNILNL